jgi:hypothetical protein
MAALTPFIGTLAGAVATPIAAAAGGDSIPGDGRTQVLVQNPTGGAITITFDAPGADSFGIVDNIHDVVVSVPAAAWRLFGPFATPRFNDANQRVQMTYSAAGLNLWPITHG